MFFFKIIFIVSIFIFIKIDIVIFIVDIIEFFFVFDLIFVVFWVVIEYGSFILDILLERKFI